MAFRVGQKVVCIYHLPYASRRADCNYPEKDSVYTVRGHVDGTDGRERILLAWWKVLADNWRGRNGNTTTGDSVRNSCADELEKVAARHTPAAPEDQAAIDEIERLQGLAARLFVESGGYDRETAKPRAPIVRPVKARKPREQRRKVAKCSRPIPYRRFDGTPVFAGREG